MTTKRDFPELLEHARQVIGDLSDGEAYLDFVRRQPCLVSAKKSDPHHAKTRGAGGSDFLAANLCREHHTEIGQIGILRFEKKYNVDIGKAIKRLHRRYGGERIVNLDKNFGILLPTLKKCSKCEEYRERDEFYKNINSKDRRSSWCKICQKIYTESYQRIHPNKIKAHPNKTKINQKFHIENLTYMYIKRLLMKTTNLKPKNIPLALMDAKRQYLMAKRKLQEANNVII